MASLPAEELRQMIRDALRELLPAQKAARESGSDGFAGRLRSALSGTRQLEVAAANAGDLTAFARELLRAAEQPDIKSAIMAGQVSFVPKGSNAAAAPVQSQRGTHRLDKGVLTESLVVELGKAHGRVVLGKSVVVTPLARDRAREVKLEIVRDKP